MDKFYTITDVKAINKNKGYHFFDREAMLFFDSKVESGVIRGNYFITSEQFNEESPRLYSVRMVLDDGRIETVGEFQAFRFKVNAQEFIKSLPDYLPDAYATASKAFNSGDWNEFGKHLISEPDYDTFTGACAYIVVNRKRLDWPFLDVWDDKVKALTV